MFDYAETIKVADFGNLDNLVPKTVDERCVFCNLLWRMACQPFRCTDPKDPEHMWTVPVLTDMRLPTFGLITTLPPSKRKGFTTPFA